jgi:UDP-N-acetylmuramate: L-alanyl-gamma-D-glutamyl-meso-diaminopimelate ligase
MLAWILEYAQLAPGYLIGGVPQNFESSARLGNAPFFVIEADEYDTAFFDKRSKFVHYRPRTLVINNLEFDHGDIFDDLAQIQRQFHHLVRMVPSNGLILSPKNEKAINEALAMGCWTPIEQSACQQGWLAQKLVADGSEFTVLFNGIKQGVVKWSLIGDFNIDNGLMAIAAARHAGVPSHIAIEALANFINTKRRLELKGVVNDISVYDDFAHHPTAIAKTLAGVRAKVDDQSISDLKQGRVLAVLEPRSNTMKSGVHKDALPKSLAQADHVFIFQDENIKWSVPALIEECQQSCVVEKSIDTLVARITEQSQAGDTIVVMSNGGFGDIHNKILMALAEKFSEDQK